MWARAVLAACVAALAAQSAAAQSEPALALDVAAAWSGHVPAGRIGEIIVGIVSTTDGTVVIELPDARPATRKTVRVHANQRASASLPLRAGTNPSVRIRAARQDGAGLETTVRPFVAAAKERPVAVAFGGEAAAATVATVPRLIVAPGTLPRTPQAFDAVRAVAIDGAALLRLDAAQRAALQRHLAECGRVAAIGLSAEARRELRALAGCGGAFLALPETVSELEPALAGILASEAPALAQPNADSPVGGLAVQVLALLGFFLGAVAAVAIATRRTWPLVAVSLAATVFAFALWHGRPPHVTLAVKEETPAGSPSSRYRTHAAIVGVGRIDARLAIPSSARLVSWPLGASIEFDDASPWQTVIFPTGLGRRHEARWEGSTEAAERRP